MTPDFTDPAARTRWDAYAVQVTRLVHRAGPDAAGLDADLLAHLADSYASQPHGSEPARIDAAIARLGDPADYLRPLLSDTLIERGARSYNPVTIGRGLYHGVLAGSARALRAGLFAAGYVLLTVFAAMTVLKPFLADRVGLIRGADGSINFGIAQNAGTDLIGLWSIPLSLAGCAAVYILLTRALRRKPPGG